MDEDSTQFEHEIKSLKEIGLNEYEARAYAILIRHGQATAGKISAQSRVPYSRIYDILESLQQKGLVKIHPGTTKTYTADDPQQLINIIEQKKKSILEAEQEAVNLKKIYETNEEDPVIITTGQKNFYKIVKEMKSAKTYSYSIRYNIEPRPEFLRKNVGAKERGVELKNLVRYDDETKENAKIWLKETKLELRKIENDGIAMSIDDDEIMISMIKSNTTMLIRDKAFVKLMKIFYENTWEKSEIVK